MEQQTRTSAGDQPRPGVRRGFTRFGATLRARNLSPRTIRSYLDTAEAFAVFCDDKFGLVELDQVTAEHVDAYIAHQLSAWTPSTAATRFRCLQQFFRFAECSGHIEASPMAELRPPKVTDAPVPVLRDEELIRLLRACDGTSFRDRRDFAMLRLLIDAGIRREELASVTTGALDLDHHLITITGKGQRVRAASFGNETSAALARYLDARTEHPHHGDRQLWLGLRGPMTGSGVRYMAECRAAQAGIDGVFPHRFRHTFAHRWLLAGGNETDLQTLAAGNHPRCSPDTAPPPEPNEPSTPTNNSPPATPSNCRARRPGQKAQADTPPYGSPSPPQLGAEPGAKNSGVEVLSPRC